ncbi:MAG: outer membrane protein assembly factor BamA [Elusimicrobia bacterium]|nr:outer membrane protein assembly factor BamA [Elusimicrobiota bacterium]
MRKYKVLLSIGISILISQVLDFSFALTPPLKVKVIKEIKITGTKNFKERAVRELIKTRPKDLYSETNLREDVQSILASGNYEDAQVETDDLDGKIRVVFKIKEKPLIKRIDFTGNKKIGKGKLKEEISLKIKEGYDSIKLSNDVKKILSLYGEKGYPDAKVEPFTTFNESLNHVSVHFIIKEGNRILIEKIEFKGAASFSQKKLRRLIKTKRRKVYDSEKLKKDLEEIEKFYKNNGYAKVKTNEQQVAYNPERTKITLTIPIEEGIRYVVGNLEFTGNTVYTSKQLEKAIELKTGKLYHQEKFEETLQNLRELYLEKGYLYSQIIPEELIENNKINYQIHIEEASIIYIDRIFIEGIKKTKDKVIRREVLLKPGDPFSSSKLRRSQEKIFNLGFIDDVKPDIQPARDPNKADLIMEIVEGKPGSLSAGAGFSSTDGLVGQVQLSHSNLFGLAQRLNLMWEFGSRKQNYEINWTEPWILNKPVSFGVDLYNTIRERLFNSDSSADYTETRRGAGVRIGPRFSDIYTLLFSYSFTSVGINRIKEEFKSQIKEETNTTSAFLTELSRDTRDYFFDATRGSRNSIAGQIAGSPVFQGDVHFLKSLFNTSWFWTTFKLGNYPFVFSVNGRFGAVQEFKPSDTVPIFERFFVGGSDSIRGYQARGEIGPIEGGRVYTLMNAEYKIPLYVENKRRILQLVLFADIGGAWRSSQEMYLDVGSSPIESENGRFLKSSIGFGMRITTPVFPIRLDWGYGLNHRAGEEVSQIHFTLGNLF